MTVLLQGANKSAAKTRRGRLSYAKGAIAEKLVALAYYRRGVDVLETRWRGKGGEIDLILFDKGVFIFCEVKAAVTPEVAISRLRPQQMQRIHTAASEYLAQTPQGQLSEVRFDLAVVDGQGRAEILDGLFSHF